MSNRKSKRKLSSKLPSLVSTMPQDLRVFCDRVRDILGDTVDSQIITVDDLVSIGVVDSNLRPVRPPPADDFLPTPPAVANLAATGAFQNIILTWDRPDYNGHVYTEVWGSPIFDTSIPPSSPGYVDPATLNNLELASPIGITTGAVFGDTIGGSKGRYYWARNVNRLDNQGPFNAVSGTLGETAVDVDFLLETLTGAITESQLFEDLATPIAEIPSISALASESASRLESFGTYDEQEGKYAVIQTLQETDTELGAQYTVKIDTNGYVSGFGLANEPVNGEIESTFIIRADSFAIAEPTAPNVSPSVQPVVPFIVRTTPTVIGGEDVPAGVYINDAFISNGTITKAKIEQATIEELFGVDATFSGTLIAGRGTFTGALDAASGTFAGELTAATGTFTGALKAGPNPAGEYVYINDASDYIAAASAEGVVFRISKSPSSSVLDGKIIEQGSILGKSLSPDAIEVIINAIGAANPETGGIRSKSATMASTGITLDSFESNGTDVDVRLSYNGQLAFPLLPNTPTPPTPSVQVFIIRGSTTIHTQTFNGSVTPSELFDSQTRFWEIEMPVINLTINDTGVPSGTLAYSVQLIVSNWDTNVYGPLTTSFTLRTSQVAGGISTSWTQLTGKPFDTIGTGLSVSGTAPNRALNAAGTNLSYTASTRLLSSSTGTNVTLPLADTTNAGLMSNTDKSKLNGIEAGAQVNVGTNLSTTGTGNTRTIVSSTGTNASFSFSAADVGAPTTTGTGASGAWDISVTGNAATVTNGVYTVGDQTIGGVKTFSDKEFRIGGNANENYIAFHGTTGDQPGNFNHTYVGEYLYGGTESSELLLFKGNDIEGVSGPDRIRSIAANHLFQTYDSALFGTFSQIASSSVPVTRMIIRQNGSVGIGTDSPTERLHVDGKIRIGTQATATTDAVRADRSISTGSGLSGGGNLTANRTLAVDSTVVRTSGDQTIAGGKTFSAGFVNIQSTGTLEPDGSAYLSYRNSSGVERAWIGYGSGSNADFAITNNLDSPVRFIVNGSDRMRITSAGNVGIGTSSPNAKLTVEHTGGTAISMPTSGAICRGGTTTLTDDLGLYSYVPGNWIRIATNNAPINFFTDAGTNGRGTTSRMYIGETGNVGIGTTSPSQRLHVVGNILASGTIRANSDARLKENIKPITNAVEKVQAITGVTYTRNDTEDKDERHTGVIAQAVEAVLPEAVATDEDGIKSVAYGNMVGLLIQAIKEQQEQIDEQQERIEKLEQRLNGE